MKLKRGAVIALNKRRPYMMSSLLSHEKCVIYGPETVLKQSHVIKLTISPINSFDKGCHCPSFNFIPPKIKAHCHFTPTVLKQTSEKIEKNVYNQSCGIFSVVVVVAFDFCKSIIQIF